MKEEKLHRQSKLELILYQAVYEGLHDVCTSIPDVILGYLEKEGSVGPGRVINNPENFDEGLKKMFGFGANILEKKILEILYDKLQIDREVKDSFSFSQEVQNVYKILPTLKVEALSFETVNIQ
ncbi:MAG: hypothetical protein PVH12_01955 [Candidatus Bathyarchaeota archaeon]